MATYATPGSSIHGQPASGNLFVGRTGARPELYGSDKLAEWKNNLFIGGLNSNHIARLVINNNKVVGEERLLSSEGHRFRDITQGKDDAYMRSRMRGGYTV